MKYLIISLLSILFYNCYGQEIIYEDRFDNNVFSVGDNPMGYAMQLVDETFQIIGNGAAGPWTAMAYINHDGSGNETLVNSSSSPKLYIKARGENSPELRIDFQDETGYVTNQNPVALVLDDDYSIYEFDYTGRLQDGAYGGPCTSAPCVVDATKLHGLIIFVNAPDGGYSGSIEIDWISLGAPLEMNDDDGSVSHEIRYNQISYLTGQSKLANIVADQAFSDLPYSVYREGESSPIMEGQVSGSAQWQPSREYVGTIDLTDIDEPGSYSLETSTESVDFIISADGYGELCKASLKYYYYNRASQELTEDYAGPWARPLGHPDDEVLIHPSAASTGRPSGTVISAPKGWYDAGDYNKYIVNSGISTYSLLAAFEHYPEYYKNLNIDIPEKGGDLPDILDEVIWNLDWMLDMQDPGDGGVYHKLTGLNFSGIIMPHQYNFTRYVVQKTTAATLNFAAVTALAARIFEEYEDVKPGYSDELLAAAKDAYEWAKANPTVYYQQPSNVNTGQYGDGYVVDEFDWAASELFISTGDAVYRADINENSIGNGVPAWPYTAPLALISLTHHADKVNSDINIMAVTSKLIATANELKSEVEQSAMRVAMGNSSGDFVWGSNGQAGNQIMMLIRAFDFTGDPSFLDAAYLAMDYLLGRNGTGFCYVSGFGDKSPRNPHHRQSEADNVSDPVPGMVAGGPNPGQQDNCSGYPNNFPASSYVDSWCSYASNEVTINWNAPLAYSINALQFYQVGVPLSSEEEIIQRPENLTVYPNPGDDYVVIPGLENSRNKTLEIIDLAGNRVMFSNKINTSKIDVSSFPKGIYMIRVIEGNLIKTAKWVKMD